MRVTLFTLLAANSALAFPMVKRQSEVLSSITSVVTQVTQIPVATSAASAVSSAAASLMPSAVASSAISSVQSQASSAVMSAVPSSAASAAPSFFPGELAYPCPAGSQLTYVETQMNYNMPLADVEASVANFGNSSLFMISNVTGQDNTVGQTRTVMIDSAMANEVLTNYTVNPETQAVYFTFNSTAPVTVNGLTVASYSSEQQTYTNDTETSATAPVSTVKLFSNICASSEADAQTFFSNFFMQALQNGTMTGASASGSASSALPAVSSAASSAVSSVQSVISSAVSSASQAVSSAVAPIASATSRASSAAASASGAATGGALQVNSPPSLIQCQPAAIVFSGGQGPYFLSVLPGGQATAAPLLQFAQQDAAGTYTWLVNISAGTSVTLQVRDGTGNINFSSPLTIMPGTTSDCLAAPTSA